MASVLFVLAFFGRKACRILAPSLGTESTLPALETKVLKPVDLQGSSWLVV